MFFDIYNYVEIPPMTGVVERDVREFLCRNGKEKTFRHVVEVAGVCKTLAETFGLDTRKCMIDGILHDISAVIAPADMLEYALEHEFELCAEEQKYCIRGFRKSLRKSSLESGIVRSFLRSAVILH